MWNDTDVGIDILNVSNQLIHCRVTNRMMHTQHLITIVYGMNDVSSRITLWRDLCDLSQEIAEEAWFVMGDFNAVLDMSEVCGASGDIRQAMEEFQACVMEMGLITLPMQGETFTWCLALATSDHSPLLLQGGSRLNYVSPFHSDNYLESSPQFLDAVKSVWMHDIEGTYMYRLMRQQKGDLSLNVQQAKEFLATAQELLAQDRHDETLLLLEHCCRIVLMKAVKLEQSMLRQWAKMQWLKEDDQCSRIFFRKVATKRATKQIFQIKGPDDNMINDQEEIVAEFVHYFETLLGGERRGRELTLEHLRSRATHVLTEEEGDMLVSQVTRDEVKEAFFDIEEDKAPGPDGFSAGFYKAAWSIVGREVTKAILESFIMADC
ncbi:UNVERIFIED_CONTAM: hypothetical protein Sindi_2691200 [Sesamum indicum]